MASLATAKTTTGIVQRVIEKELRHGKPTAERVARALHMSRRTMSRRLEQEGTDFSAEMDAVRRETALECIRNGEARLIEIAFLSGFSHVESFHRAFRRWTGMSPLEYRNRLGAHRFGVARRVVGGGGSSGTASRLGRRNDKR